MSKEPAPAKLPQVDLPEVTVNVDAADDYGTEPRELIERTDVILRAGRIALSTGIDSGRVIDMMRLVAQSVDCDALTVSISYPQITVTVQRGHIYRTKVGPAATPAVNSDKACELWAYMMEMHEGMSPAEINQKFDEIEAQPHLYNPNVLPFIVAVACVCYGILNNMGLYEIPGTFIAVALGHRLRLFLNHKHVNHLANVVLAALVSGFTYLGYLTLIHGMPNIPTDRAVIGFIASVLYLIPGFPIVSGSLELGRLDLSSAVNRLTYASLVLLSGGIGIWVVSMFSPMDPSPVLRFDIPDWQVLTMKGIVTFIGVAGFARMFNSRWLLSFAAGGIAMVGNVLRLALAEYVMPGHAAAAVACFVVGILAWWVSRITQWPSVVMAVPATLVMVPGAVAYRALLYFNINDMTHALQYGTSALLIIIGIAVGLLAARMVTDPRWTLSRDVPPTLDEMMKRHIAH